MNDNMIADAELPALEGHLRALENREYAKLRSFSFIVLLQASGGPAIPQVLTPRAFFHSGLMSRQDIPIRIIARLLRDECGKHDLTWEDLNSTVASRNEIADAANIIVKEAEEAGRSLFGEEFDKLLIETRESIKLEMEYKEAQKSAEEDSKAQYRGLLMQKLEEIRDNREASVRFCAGAIKALEKMHPENKSMPRIKPLLESMMSVASGSDIADLTVSVLVCLELILAHSLTWNDMDSVKEDPGVEPYFVWMLDYYRVMSK